MGFAKDGYLFIGAGLRIPVSEIVWRFNPSGGPGGQHANKASTRVEAELNLGRLGINEETKNKRKPTKPTRSSNEKTLEK